MKTLMILLCTAALGACAPLPPVAAAAPAASAYDGTGLRIDGLSCGRHRLARVSAEGLRARNASWGVTAVRSC